MSPARGLYLMRAVKILSPLTAGCESTLHEKGPASGYTVICFFVFVEIEHCDSFLFSQYLVHNCERKEVVQSVKLKNEMLS